MDDPRGQDKTDAQARPLCVIPDMNVLVHGRALVDLPWEELARDPVQVVIVPPVVREIDKLKNQSGRPNKIARQLSSDVRALIKAPGGTASVRESGPTVTKRFERRRVTAAHDGLDLNHADQALINYALHMIGDGHEVLLLTDDTICATTAEEFGLPVMLMPDGWARDTEPDQTQKENARLTAELRRRDAAEPQVALSFLDLTGEPIATLEAEIVRWPALTAAEIDGLMEEVARLCPPATSFTPPKTRATDMIPALAAAQRFRHLASLHTQTVREPATEAEIEEYREKDHPAWLESVRGALAGVHNELQSRAEYPVVLAIAANKGTRPAKDTLLSISAKGGIAIKDEESADGEGVDDGDNGDHGDVPTPPEIYSLPLPPTPPRGRIRHASLFGSHAGFTDVMMGRIIHPPLHLPTLPQIEPRRDDVFYWREGRDDWVDRMQLECASWRHSHDDVVFRLRVCPDGLEAASGVVEMTVHASNLTDPAMMHLPVRIMVADGATLEQARSLVAELGRAARVSGRL